MIRLYSAVLGPMRRRAVICIVLFTLSGLAEGLGIASLLPFLQGTGTGGGTTERFGLRGDDLAAAALVALIAFGVFSSVLRYFADVRLYRLQADVEASLRQRMTAALFSMRWTDYHAMSFGDAAKSVLNEGQQIGTGINGMVSGLGNVTIAAVFVVVAAVISVEMTAATLVFGAAMVLVYRSAGRRAEQKGAKLSSQATVVTELVNDLFNHYKFYRSTGHRADALKRSKGVFAEWGDDFVRVMRYQPATRLWFDVAGLVFIAAVLAISVLVAGSSAASAFVFLALFYRLTPKLQLAQNGLLVAKAQGAWWTDWKDRYDRAVAALDARPGTKQFSAPPAITLRDVSFTYPARPDAVLDDVSWQLGPGECLAIVGDSGSGKTTSLDLVTGVLRPQQGEVLLDDVDLDDVDVDAWQRRIGLVMQDAPTFFGTVLENIAWADPTPDPARAMHCAELANVAGVIEALPDGLASEVGQQGSRLSGGQRQRIGLARALYHEPWLLVLDEATSALDSESEQAIQAALTRLKGSCSMLLVAHRLKTVELADRIVVMAGGRIAETGTWADLQGRPDGRFRRMLDLQGTSAATDPHSG